MLLPAGVLHIFEQRLRARQIIYQRLQLIFDHLYAVFVCGAALHVGLTRLMRLLPHILQLFRQRLCQQRDATTERMICRNCVFTQSCGGCTQRRD
jgi:radical SAM protein with 4Fe4S-binding SPASM domain